MRKKWIIIGLAVGLLAMALTGGAALAWGGPGDGWGWGRGDHDERNTAVAEKVAEILGTDADETADAISQAQQEVRDEAADAALDDLAGRVAETLGTDAVETADAIESVSKEVFSEALEERLQNAIDDGHITEEQAQEYRDKADSYSGWYGYRGSFKGSGGIDNDDFAERVGDELDVDGGNVKDAIEQALSDIGREALEEKLQDAVDDGRITQDRADEILEDYDSGDGHRFNKRGHHGRHGGKGHWSRGRGHHGSGGSDSDATATPEPTVDGDST